MASVLTTERLTLRPPVEQDAAFFLRLLNEPSWLRFIGDRVGRTLDEARIYIRTAVASQTQPGLGIYVVTLRAANGRIHAPQTQYPQTQHPHIQYPQMRGPIGICTLIRRQSLDDVDLGFAFLPDYWSCGFAHEATTELLRHAIDTIGLRRIIAITLPENYPSTRLLEKLGLRFERRAQLADDSTWLHLMALNVSDNPAPAEHQVAAATQLLK